MMENKIQFDKNYIKSDFPLQSYMGFEFENCIFENCDWSQKNFKGSTFIDCEFIDCNLTAIDFSGVGLKNVTFNQCKMLGIAFQSCDDFLFSIHCKGSVLNMSSFVRKKLVDSTFFMCDLKEVNFAEANLTKVDFFECNLENAFFNSTNLTKVNLKTAHNFTIDPNFNTVQNLEITTSGLAGLLTKFQLKISQ